ncbi:MAG: LPXTG cell wall anchor domain-containing protein [Thermomicrobiales bacterium]
MPNTGASPTTGSSNWFALALVLLFIAAGLFFVSTKRRNR